MSKKHVIDKLYTHTCENPKCGKQFETTAKWQKYCCSECRVEVANYWRGQRGYKPDNDCDTGELQYLIRGVIDMPPDNWMPLSICEEAAWLRG